MSHPNDWLSQLLDQPLTPVEDRERRAARVTAAQAALAGGWTAELRGVLDMLGLGAA
jgi:hypothetical protein